MTESDYLIKLADLTVRFGANVQPGQILAISSEPGKEPLARAIAEAAYAQGALFVDVTVFDPYLKRARAQYADRDTLSFVPPWLGERILALGEHRCAWAALTGPTAPALMEGIDPALLSLDLLPAVRESSQVINEATVNWTAVPCPTQTWATLVYPQLDAPAALTRLWEELGHICRLDEEDPIAAWEARLAKLVQTAHKLDDLHLDALRFHGPGTDLTVGLLPSSRWDSARFATVDGIVHTANIPTEEVFTTPDPERVNGVVTATKPLFHSGTTISGLKVSFQDGRAVRFDADRGAEVLRGLSEHDEGAARLGEVALVDREGRIGPLNTVFFDTLVDENAASHIALGHGYETGVREPGDLARVNQSQIHVDFMIGGDDVAVTGVLAGGEQVALLRGGAWQI